MHGRIVKSSTMVDYLTTDAEMKGSDPARHHFGGFKVSQGYFFQNEIIRSICEFLCQKIDTLSTKLREEDFNIPGLGQIPNLI